jgi:RNA polymerase sigma-70 factor (ECF subfamily)
MSDQSSDLALLGAWRSGNAGAGELLFARHFRAVYRFFETKYPSDVDELVQATFLACVGAKHRFHEGSSFRAYLFTVARHELYRVIGERQRALGRIDFAVSSIEELVPTPGTRMDGRRERVRLLEALRSMPVDVQMLLELHYWQGVGIGELAAIFEAPEVTIRSRLHRARAAVRERMARDVDVAGEIGETLEDFDVWARNLGGRKAYAVSTNA